MSDVAEALRRAKIRIRYHGWRRSTAGPKEPGWTLTEAIVGRKPTVIPEHELRALVAVAEAIGVSQGELDEWNDAPYRTAKDVLKALARARKAVEAPPTTVPDRCAQRRMSEQEEIDKEMAEIGAVLKDIGADPRPFAEVAEEGTVPLHSFTPNPQWDSTLDEQVDLEEVIKDHLRRR